LLDRLINRLCTPGRAINKAGAHVTVLRDIAVQTG